MCYPLGVCLCVLMGVSHGETSLFLLWLGQLPPTLEEGQIEEQTGVAGWKTSLESVEESQKHWALHWLSPVYKQVFAYGSLADFVLVFPWTPRSSLSCPCSTRCQSSSGGTAVRDCRRRKSCCAFWLWLTELLTGQSTLVHFPSHFASWDTHSLFF